MIIFRRRRPSLLFALAALTSVVTLMGVSSAQATVPALKEKLYECKPITAANRVEPPAPLWEVNGEPEPAMSVVHEDALAEEPCPAGEIAYPTGFQAPNGGPAETIDGQVRSTSAVNAERQSVLATPSYTPAGSGPTAELAPPRNPEEEGYRYVSMAWETPSVGGSIKISVAQPTVDEHTRESSHSIAQLAYSSGPNAFDTVELGWDVSPHQFGEKRPHLFTFVNNDEYLGGGDDCYDCHFVPVTGPDFTPGQALESNENPIEFAVKYEEGNWWVYVYDQWIGYLEGGFWNHEFTHPSRHSYYGEVFSEEGGYPLDSMGNGLFGASPGSIKMASPEHFPSLKSAATETLAEAEEPQVSNPDLYTYGRVPVGDNEWHFGGPGGQRISLVDSEGRCIGVEHSNTENGNKMNAEPCIYELPSEEFMQAVYPGESFQLIDRNDHLCRGAPCRSSTGRM